METEMEDVRSTFRGPPEREIDDRSLSDIWWKGAAVAMRDQLVDMAVRFRKTVQRDHGECFAEKDVLLAEVVQLKKKAKAYRTIALQLLEEIVWQNHQPRTFSSVEQDFETRVEEHFQHNGHKELSAFDPQRMCECCMGNWREHNIWCKEYKTK